MSAPHDPDEGLGGRVLLAMLGFGLVPMGLLTETMMTLDVDADRSDGLLGVTIACVGAGAMIAAAVGRAFGRWALATLGLLLLAAAAGLLWEAVPDHYDEPVGLVGAVLAALVILGVSAIGVAVRQLVAHRRRISAAGIGWHDRQVSGRS